MFTTGVLVLCTVCGAQVYFKLLFNVTLNDVSVIYVTTQVSDAQKALQGQK